MEVVDEFRLLPEEHATLGISYRGGRLRLRPTAQVFAYAAILATFGCVLPFIGLSLSGGALILVALGPVLLVRGVLIAVTAVVADEEQLTIRNWASWKRIPIASIGSVATDYRHFPLGKAPYSNLWAGPKHLVAGYVTDATGRRLYCDVATSPPRGQGIFDRFGLGGASFGPETQTSAEVKMAALKRWVSAPKRTPGSSDSTGVQR